MNLRLHQSGICYDERWCNNPKVIQGCKGCESLVGECSDGFCSFTGSDINNNCASHIFKFANIFT